MMSKIKTITRDIYRRFKFYRPDGFKLNSTMAQFFINRPGLKSSYAVCDFLGFMLGDYRDGINYEFEIRDSNGIVCQKHRQTLAQCESFEFIPDYSRLPESGSCYITAQLNTKFSFNLALYRQLSPHFYVRYFGENGIGLVHTQTALSRKSASNAEWFSSSIFQGCDGIELLILNPSPDKLTGSAFLLDDRLAQLTAREYSINPYGVTSVNFSTDPLFQSGYRIGLAGMGATNAKPHAIVWNSENAYIMHT